MHNHNCIFFIRNLSLKIMTHKIYKKEMCIHVHIYIYVYICINAVYMNKSIVLLSAVTCVWERERERERERGGGMHECSCVCLCTTCMCVCVRVSVCFSDVQYINECRMLRMFYNDVIVSLYKCFWSDHHIMFI